MSDQCFAGPGCHTERSGRLREQFEGPAPEQPASIVRFLLLDRPLGPNVENEMDDPNMHAYGEDGQDDAEIRRQWRENSSLEKWFPLTAERLAAKERENLHLAREARTWWEACRDATGEAERLRGETDVLRAWIKAALVPLQSIADLEDFEDGGDGMNALIDAGRKFVRWSGLFGGNVNTSRGPASILGTPPTGNCGQCQWSAGRARSETRRIDKETGMKIQTVEDAIEAYTAQDAWQFADRQAAWAWMFEQGRKAGMNECYRLAMTASEPAKGGSFNDGKWAVADAIKMRAAGGCDCMTCTCQPDD